MLLKIIDRLAGAWFDWRTNSNLDRSAVANEIKFKRIEFKDGNLDIQASHELFAILGSEAAKILKENNAVNYLEFHLMPRPDHGSRLIRITIQYADGLSPAQKANDLEIKMQVAEKVNKIYFDIAADVLGEDEVRRRRDEIIAAATSHNG